MTDRPTILEFVTDPQLLGLTPSPAQRTLLKAAYGLPLTAEERELFTRCTGLAEYPGHAFDEVVALCGARSGKDAYIATPIIVYEAIFGDAEQHLGKGERATCVLIAQDQKSTRTAYGYCRDYVLGSALLKTMIEEVREQELRLTNRTIIACFASSAKSVRGWSIPAGVMDELGFYRLEAGASTDSEVQTSIRRGGVGFPSQKLVKISTPYMKSGVLWADFQDYYGKPNPDVLVWQAPTLLMNPTIDAARLQRERRKDPTRHAREYEAMFSDDLAAFLAEAWLDAAVVDGRYELAPRAGIAYVATADTTGGSTDTFTLSICHAEDSGRIVQDLIKGWTGSRTAKVDLGGVVAEIAETVRRYGLTEVSGDRYAGAWVTEAFAKAGIAYRAATMDKSRAYLESEPLFSSGRVELLDHPAMRREFGLLERRLRPGGKSVVDHPRGSHDDYANATALGIAQTAQGVVVAADVGVGGDMSLSTMRSGPEQEPAAPRGRLFPDLDPVAAVPDRGAPIDLEWVENQRRIFPRRAGGRLWSR
jgi:hypothetical protein